MDSETDSVAVGLNLFLRKTLQRAIESICATDDPVFRLSNNATASSCGWDAATSDLSTLLSFALVCVARSARGLSFIPLRQADDSIVERPQRDDAPGTASENASVAVALVKEGILRMRDARGLAAAQSVSVCTLIKKRLGLRPQHLVRPLYETQRQADRAFSRDPEAQVIAGLAAFLIHVLEVSQAAAAQNIASISLVIWGADCGDPCRVRLANISSLMTGGLLAEEGRTIAFIPSAAPTAHARTVH